MEGHSESAIEYRDDVRVLHIEPITHQQVQILQGRSPPDVSKLEGIAATSEQFKHRDQVATLVLHATEKKHDNRYHFYWYFTIPTLVTILLIIIVCNSYPYIFRNLLHKFRRKPQTVAKSSPENESQSPSEVPPKLQPRTSQLQPSEGGRKPEFVTYSMQVEA